MSPRCVVFVLLVLLAAAPCEAAEQGAAPRDEARERVAAVEAAFREGGAQGARRIAVFLRDRDLGVRSHAMKRLVDLGAAAVDPLIEALADEQVRWLASGALINIGREAVEPVVRALKHGDPAVRRNAVFILRQLDARQASPAIRAALSDPDPSVRIQAIQTVAQFGGEKALELVLAQADSPVSAVRDAAVEALARFGKEALPALASMLSYGNADTRAAVIRALGSTGLKEAREPLRRALSDPSPLVRYYVCQMLGETEDPWVLEDLAGRFDDPDASVREAAAEAFARMAEAGRPLLFRLLREGNPLQKITAAAAARRARFRPAVPLLVEALRDPSGDVRVAAAAALMTIADPASVEALVNGLRDETVRWLCILALRQFGDRNLGPLLRRTGDPELDYWKQYVLEGMGDRVLEGCLETLRKEEDLSTRIASLCTLRQIKDARAVYPLIRLMADERLGYVACFVVAQMGEAAVEPLLLSLADDNPVIRARAATALGEIGFSRVVRPLQDLLADRDPEVRRAAEQAIRKIGGSAGPPPPSPVRAAGPEPCLK